MLNHNLNFYALSTPLHQLARNVFTNVKRMEKAFAKKQPYPEIVKQRARDVHAKVVAANDGEQAISIVYEALKTTALESWKNGLSAGSRKKDKPGNAPASA